MRQASAVRGSFGHPSDKRAPHGGFLRRYPRAADSSFALCADSVHRRGHLRIWREDAPARARRGLKCASPGSRHPSRPRRRRARAADVALVDRGSDVDPLRDDEVSIRQQTGLGTFGGRPRRAPSCAEGRPKTLASLSSRARADQLHKRLSHEAGQAAGKTAPKSAMGPEHLTGVHMEIDVGRLVPQQHSWTQQHRM